MLNSGWNGLNEDEAFEQQLRGLTPGTHCIDRDLLMFRAGQATEQRHLSRLGGRAWQVTSLISSVAAAVLGATLLMDRAVARPTRDLASQSGSADGATAAGLATQKARPFPPPPRTIPGYPPQVRQQSAGWAQYATLRDKVLGAGVDILPRPVLAPVAEADAVLSARSWLLQERRHGGMQRSRSTDRHAEGELL